MNIIVSPKQFNQLVALDATNEIDKIEKIKSILGLKIFSTIPYDGLKFETTNIIVDWKLNE